MLWMKAAVYRVMASLLTGLAAWAVTGELSLAGLLLGIDFFAKLIGYYLFERAWSAAMERRK